MGAYAIGMSVLGTDGLPRAVVKSQNTAGYVLPDMSDASAKTLGDADPTLMINPGVEVAIVGPAAQNAHGVSYMPVKMIGQDDNRVFWVRSTSLAAVASSQPIAAPAPSFFRPSAPTATLSVAPAQKTGERPWWQYALIAVGVGVVGFGAYEIVTIKRP